VNEKLSEIPMRRTPRQVRSQQRVDLILATAAELFAEVGYEAATTNAIAARAGISIGSLYRYFPDKDAILQALIESYFEQLQGLYDQVFTEDAVYLPLAVLIERLIGPFVALYKEYPALKHILLSTDVSPDIAEAAAKLEGETTQRIMAFIHMNAPELEEERVYLTAVVSKSIFKATLSLITPDTSEEFQAQVVAEIKRLLLAYLRPIVGRE
jgi:AcrR family transcriptional regulator